MVMADGRESPCFGTKNVLSAELEIDASKPITRIEMLTSTDKKYLNAIKFYTSVVEREEL